LADSGKGVEDNSFIVVVGASSVPATLGITCTELSVARGKERVLNGSTT
jgi:hypothetical protein